MQQQSDVQIWLKPLTGARRLEQSQSVRLLLQQACEARDLTIAEDHLSLPGLALIEHVRSQHNLSISLAHCPGMAALALGKGELGLDCEQIGRNRRWGDIAQQFFTAEEAAKINTVPGCQRESEFLRHWVLKEAYIKATYGGVFGDLNRLALTISGGIALSEPERTSSANWVFWYANYGEFHFGICNNQSAMPKLQFLASKPSQATAYTDITADITAKLLLAS